MKDPSGSLVAILPGFVFLVLLCAAVIAVVISYILLARYRAAVYRSMGSEQEQCPDNELPIGNSVRAIGTIRTSVTHLEPSPSESLEPPGVNLFREARIRRRQSFIVYAIAGLGAAVVLSIAFLAATDLASESVVRLAIQLLLLICVYAWPVVLTYHRVTAFSRKRQLVAVLIYWAVLIIIIQLARIASPAITTWQGIGLWVAINILPTMFWISFHQRRVRAVGPLVFVFMVVAIIGSQAVLHLVNSSYTALNLFVSAGNKLGMSAIGVFVLMTLFGFFLFAILGLVGVRWIRYFYESKVLSDQLLAIDTLWILFSVTGATSLLFHGVGWLLMAPITFATYRILLSIGFVRLRRGWPNRALAPTILQLRVFAHGSQSEKLFDFLDIHWRHLGNWYLIAGPDLAASTVEPHEFLDYVGGRLSRRFIHNDEEHESRISEIDLARDLDGRFRVNEFFCSAVKWKSVLTSLVANVDVALLDLRGFGETNEGCVYEIQALINLLPIERVVVVVDESTDIAFLEKTVRLAWSSMRKGSPNETTTDPSFVCFALPALSSARLQLLLGRLCTASTVDSEGRSGIVIRE